MPSADGFRIGAVAVSPSYGAGRTIAVGLRYVLMTVDYGYVFTMEAGAVLPGWRDQGFRGTADPFDGGDVLAIKFSPNYSGDFAYFIVSTE